MCNKEPLEIFENETEQARHLAELIRQLFRFVSDFEHAVSLYNFCNTFSPVTRHWSFIAGRDGAMTLYHIADIINAVQNGFRDCPNLSSNVDHRSIRSARRAFKQYFPMTNALRNAVAHSGERNKTRDLWKENTVSTVEERFKKFIVFQGEGSTIDIDECFFEDDFAKTFKGRIVYYEISRESLAKLLTIACDIKGAFPSNLGS